MLIGLGSYIFRFAVGTSTYHNPNPLGAVDVVKRAAELGAKVLQFAENLPLDDLPDETLGEMKRIADEAGMTLEVGTAGASEEQMLKHLRIATKLGAKLLRLSLQSGSIDLTIEEAKRAIFNVVPKFREHGISIAIENHFTMKSEDMFNFIQEINDPLVGVCLDTANSIAQQEWPEETIRILGPLALSIHLKDYQLYMQPNGIGVNVRGVPLGEGRQNLDAITEFLSNHNRDINIILEGWMPPLETVEETLQQEDQWIRKSLEVAQRFKKITI